MIKFLKKQSLWSIVALSLLLVACNDDDEDDDDMPPSSQPTQTIVEIASGNPDFSVLVEALTAADLVDDVSGDDLTVFAPNNEAFNNFFDSFGLIDEDGDGSRVNDAIAALGAETVIETLKYHVLLAEVRAADVPELGYVTTYSTNSPGNNPLSLLVESRSNGVFLNNGPQVSQPDILATNGVIHAINEVITMPNIVDHAINNPALLSELTNAVVGANLVGALSDENATLTVFAPRNSGFEAIESTIATLSDEQISTVLTYHVLATQERADDLVSQSYNTLANQEITVAVGTSVEITDISTLSEGPSTVEVPNIQATNGVVHLIDNVLIPAL